MKVRLTQSTTAVLHDPSAVQDLVIPSFKSPRHYEKSSLQGAPARERDLLFFFR